MTAARLIHLDQGALDACTRLLTGEWPTMDNVDAWDGNTRTVADPYEGAVCVWDVQKILQNVPPNAFATAQGRRKLLYVANMAFCPLSNNLSTMDVALRHISTLWWRADMQVQRGDATGVLNFLRSPHAHASARTVSDMVVDVLHSLKTLHGRATSGEAEFIASAVDYMRDRQQRLQTFFVFANTFAQHSSAPQIEAVPGLTRDVGITPDDDSVRVEQKELVQEMCEFLRRVGMHFMPGRQADKSELCSAVYFMGDTGECVRTGEYRPILSYGRRIYRVEDIPVFLAALRDGVTDEFLRSFPYTMQRVPQHDGSFRDVKVYPPVRESLMGGWPMTLHQRITATRKTQEDNVKYPAGSSYVKQLIEMFRIHARDSLQMPSPSDGRRIVIRLYNGELMMWGERRIDARGHPHFHVRRTFRPYGSIPRRERTQPARMVLEREVKTSRAYENPPVTVASFPKEEVERVEREHGGDAMYMDGAQVFLRCFQKQGWSEDTIRRAMAFMVANVMFGSNDDLKFRPTIVLQGESGTGKTKLLESFKSLAEIPMLLTVPAQPQWEMTELAKPHTARFILECPSVTNINATTYFDMMDGLRSVQQRNTGPVEIGLASLLVATNKTDIDFITGIGVDIKASQRRILWLRFQHEIEKDDGEAERMLKNNVSLLWWGLCECAKFSEGLAANMMAPGGNPLVTPQMREWRMSILRSSNEAIDCILDPSLFSVRIGSLTFSTPLEQVKSMVKGALRERRTNQNRVDHMLGNDYFVSLLKHIGFQVLQDDGRQPPSSSTGGAPMVDGDLHAPGGDSDEAAAMTPMEAAGTVVYGIRPVDIELSSPGHLEIMRAMMSLAGRNSPLACLRLRRNAHTGMGRLDEGVDALCKILGLPPACFSNLQPLQWRIVLDGAARALASSEVTDRAVTPLAVFAQVDVRRSECAPNGRTEAGVSDVRLLSLDVSRLLSFLLMCAGVGVSAVAGEPLGAAAPRVRFEQSRPTAPLGRALFAHEVLPAANHWLVSLNDQYGQIAADTECLDAALEELNVEMQWRAEQRAQLSDDGTVAGLCWLRDAEPRGRIGGTYGCRSPRRSNGISPRNSPHVRRVSRRRLRGRVILGGDCAAPLDIVIEDEPPLAKRVCTRFEVDPSDWGSDDDEDERS